MLLNFVFSFWEQGVVGSNPATPTMRESLLNAFRSVFERLSCTPTPQPDNRTVDKTGHGLYIRPLTSIPSVSI